MTDRISWSASTDAELLERLEKATDAYWMCSADEDPSIHEREARRIRDEILIRLTALRTQAARDREALEKMTELAIEAHSFMPPIVRADTLRDEIAALRATEDGREVIQRRRPLDLDDTGRAGIEAAGAQYGEEG